MGAGVGLFIGMIGLQSGGIIADHPSTLLTLGELTTVDTILAAFGFLLITGLSIKKVPGAILIGVLTITVLGLASGLVTYEGIFFSATNDSADIHAAGYRIRSRARHGKHYSFHPFCEPF